jgi:hypothetical protein
MISRADEFEREWFREGMVPRADESSTNPESEVARVKDKERDEIVPAGFL